MAFKLEYDYRSFGGKKFRPQPTCHFDEDTGLFLCITPWGNADIANVVIESIKNFLALANEDSEITVPYEKKPNLDRGGNDLRMAVMMASEKVYIDFNKTSYSAGFEIFAGIYKQRQWTFVCCGQPSLILLRPKIGALPIHTSLDLNVKASNQILKDPLPSHMLGMGQRPPIHFGHQTLHKKDRYALVSRSYVPNDFFSMSDGERTIESLSKVMAKDNADVPFWLGLLKFQ